MANIRLKREPAPLAKGRPLGVRGVLPLPERGDEVPRQLGAVELALVGICDIDEPLCVRGIPMLSLPDDAAHPYVEVVSQGLDRAPGTIEYDGHVFRDDVPQDEHELVATPARNKVIHAHGAGERRCRLNEDGVAGGVAHAIVDVFESDEVNGDDSDAFDAVFRLPFIQRMHAEFTGNTVDDRLALHELRQLIGECEVA